MKAALMIALIACNASAEHLVLVGESINRDGPSTRYMADIDTLLLTSDRISAELWEFRGGQRSGHTRDSVSNEDCDFDSGVLRSVYLDTGKSLEFAWAKGGNKVSDNIALNLCGGRRALIAERKQRL